MRTFLRRLICVLCSAVLVFSGPVPVAFADTPDPVSAFISDLLSARPLLNAVDGFATSMEWRLSGGIAGDEEIAAFLAHVTGNLGTYADMCDVLAALEQNWPALDVADPDFTRLYRPPASLPGTVSPELAVRYSEFISAAEPFTGSAAAVDLLSPLLYPAIRRWIAAWAAYAYVYDAQQSGIDLSNGVPAPVTIDLQQLIADELRRNSELLQQLIDLMDVPVKEADELPPEFAPYVLRIAPEDWALNSFSFPDGKMLSFQEQRMANAAAADAASGHSVMAVNDRYDGNFTGNWNYYLTLDESIAWYGITTPGNNCRFGYAYAISSSPEAVIWTHHRDGSTNRSAVVQATDQPGVYESAPLVPSWANGISRIVFSGRYLELDGVLYDFEGGTEEPSDPIPAPPTWSDSSGLDDVIEVLQSIDASLGDFAGWLYEFDSWFGRSVVDGLSGISSRMDVLLSRLRSWFDDVIRAIDRLADSLSGLGSDPGSLIDSGALGVVGSVLDFLAGLLPGPADLAAFSSLVETVSGIFPLSIPWDIAGLLALFSAEPVIPVFSLPMPVPASLHAPAITVDLTPFDSLAVVVREGEYLVFVLALLSRFPDDLHFLLGFLFGDGS